MSKVKTFYLARVNEFISVFKYIKAGHGTIMCESKSYCKNRKVISAHFDMVCIQR